MAQGQPRSDRPRSGHDGFIVSPRLCDTRRRVFLQSRLLPC